MLNQDVILQLLDKWLGLHDRRFVCTPRCLSVFWLANQAHNYIVLGLDYL